MSARLVPPTLYSQRARTLVILRHGETEWNREFRFQGRTDIPLNDTGHAQAEAAAPHVARLAPTRIVSSPLIRARETAEAVARHLGGMTVETHPGLMETHLGEWEGKRDGELAATVPEGLRRWRRGELDFPAGVSGETKIDVGARMLSAVEEIMESSDPGSTTLLVTHGGASRALIGRLMRLDPEDWEVFEGLGNCHWSVLREDLDGVDEQEKLSEGEAGASDSGTDSVMAGDGTNNGPGTRDGGATSQSPGHRRWRLRQHNVGPVGLT